MDKSPSFEEMTARMTERVIDGLKTGHPLNRIVSELVMRSAEWGSENRRRFAADAKLAESSLNEPSEDAIHAVMRVRHDRERARFRMVLSLMGVDLEVISEASTKLACVMEQFPSGSLVLTHGPFEMAAEKPGATFHNLIAMWWQDDDYGSQFNELLWERSR